MIAVGILVFGRLLVPHFIKNIRIPIEKGIQKIGHALLFKVFSIIAVVIALVINLIPLIKQLRQEPNVLILIVDTLRSDYTAIGNNTTPNTPYLKADLMPDSLCYSNAFSNSPWTLPSVSSLLTSQYPSRLNINNLVSRLDEKHLTLTEILRERGYFTYGAVSHLLLQQKYGLHQGFNIYNEKNISAEYYNHNSISSPGITDNAIQFIRKNRKRKFFMLLHYFDPHYSYINHNPSSSYSGEFTSRDISYLRALIRENKYAVQDIDYLKDSYSSEIVFTDFHIGKVIDELKSKNIYDKTLIVFTSDHGEEFVEKGWLGHSTTLYNEQIKIPLLIKRPSTVLKFEAPTQSQFVSNIDIAPSVLRLLGISPSPQFQGEDIFSDNSENRFVFSEVVQREYGELKDKTCVISNGWKLIYDFVTKQYELYNLEKDRDENKNILGSNGDVERTLKMRLGKWSNENRIKPQPAKLRKPLTDQEKKKLKSLGYIK
ncbi:sulfatase [Acidobacteriota bacterium]